MPVASGAIERALSVRTSAVRGYTDDGGTGWIYGIGDQSLIGVDPFDPPPPHTISAFLDWWRGEDGPGGRRKADRAERGRVKAERRKLGRARRKRAGLRRERMELWKEQREFVEDIAIYEERIAAERKRMALYKGRAERIMGREEVIRRGAKGRIIPTIEGQIELLWEKRVRWEGKRQAAELKFGKEFWTMDAESYLFKTQRTYQRLVQRHQGAMKRYEEAKHRVASLTAGQKWLKGQREKWIATRSRPVEMRLKRISRWISTLGKYIKENEP
jgi:ribosome-binding protein aMBF1 (putative translation factor)